MISLWPPEIPDYFSFFCQSIWFIVMWTGLEKVYITRWSNHFCVSCALDFRVVCARTIQQGVHSDFNFFWQVALDMTTGTGGLDNLISDTRTTESTMSIIVYNRHGNSTEKSQSSRSRLRKLSSSSRPSGITTEKNVILVKVCVFI